MNNTPNSIPFGPAVRNFVKDWVEGNIETLDVAIVVGVSKYQDRLVDVLPLCIQEDPDGLAPAKPTITECPVILQGNSDGFINFPLRKGDKVLIGYPKDSIEEFTYGQNSDQYYPVDTMKFQGSQAVVLGYASQVGQDHTLSSENFEIKYYNSRITITPDNRITINNDGATVDIENDGAIGITNGESTYTMQANGDVELINDTCELSMTNAGTIILDNGGGQLEMLPTGSCKFTNGNGNLSLAPAGNAACNNCIITTSGNVITASGTDLDSLKANFDALVTSYNAHGNGAANHNPPVPPYTPV